MVPGSNPNFCGQLRGLLREIDEAIEQVIKQGRGRLAAILNDTTAMDRPPTAQPVQPTGTSESTTLVYVLRSMHWATDGGQVCHAPYTLCQLPTRFLAAARSRGLVDLPDSLRAKEARRLVAADGVRSEAIGSTDLDELLAVASPVAGLPGAEVRVGAARTMCVAGNIF
jgi:hypothetical protein